MCVFQVFKIVQMVPNRAKHHIQLIKNMFLLTEYNITTPIFRKCHHIVKETYILDFDNNFLRTQSPYLLTKIIPTIQKITSNFVHTSLQCYSGPSDLQNFFN